MIKVVLVDKKDRKIGVGEKLKVHKEGKLHRCFSIFIFNSRGEILIQKRAKSKYHSAGLWANACCSHPRPNKNLKNEARKRLKEEMGLTCNIKEIFSLIYKVKLAKLTEHEFNHVFIGKFDGVPKINPREVEGWKWISLKKDIKECPKKYAPWFRLILKKISSKTKI